MPSQAVLTWLDALETDQLELHSFMLLRAGSVIAEGWWSPYSRARLHRLHSLSKSFTSTAIGLLVTAGRLSVDERLVNLFPESLPAAVSDHLAAMRVQDLLTMRTGHAQDVTDTVVQAPDGDWVRAFLAQPVDFPPGTHFVYNSAATFMLSALVQHLTAETLLDFLRPRLLEPLGIQEAHWQVNPQGINVGGWGLHLSTDGIARFGQCLLQEGRWESQPLIPQAWVQQATQAHVPPGPDAGTNDWANGYGYQFWRCRHGAYRADGAFGQFCVVMPEQQAVLAMTANVPDMQAVLNHVWTHLLPALGAKALPENPTAQAALQARCAGLHLAFPEIKAEWGGTPRDGRYVFDSEASPWQAARLTTTANACRLTLTDAHTEQRLEFGLGTWHEGRAALWPGFEEPVLARAGWQPDGQLALTFLFIEGGYRAEALLDEQAGTLTVNLPATLGVDASALIAHRAD